MKIQNQMYYFIYFYEPRREKVKVGQLTVCHLLLILLPTTK